MTKWKAHARSLALIFVVPAITLACSIYTVFVVVPSGSAHRGERIIRKWSKILCRVAGVRLHVTGLENLKGLGSIIIVSNHLSHYDIPVLFCALPLSFRMLAKFELFKIPLFGRAMRSLGFVPVQRESAEGAKTVMTELEKRFGEGTNIWIAAEGTRYRGEGVGQFKSGAFHMALKTGHTIVPVCIYGTQKVLPKGSLFVNWNQWTQDVFVRVCPRVLPKSAHTRHELRAQVRGTIVAEFEKLRVGHPS